MKTARFLLVIVMGAVSLPGTSFAWQVDHPSQPVPSQSGEKSADRQKDDVRNVKDQARPAETDENREQPADVTRTTTKHRSSTSHSKPAASHQTHPARTPTKSSSRTGTLGSVAPPEQMGSRAANNLPNKAVSHRNLSMLPSAVSVNGRQFRNSHDPGAHLAISGGPQTSARGTAAISGTDMKRKP
jgi:hypothetical protein